MSSPTRICNQAVQYVNVLCVAGFDTERGKNMLLKQLTSFFAILALAIAVPKIAWSTVSNTTVSTTTGMGDGATTIFTITFDFRATSEVVVTKYDNSTSPATVTVLSQGSGSTQFQVTKSDGTSCAVASGGPGTCTSVKLGTAPTNTQYLVITRNLPLTQPVVLNPASIFPYQGLSNQIDQMTLILQNLNAGIGGSSGGSGGGSGGDLPSGVAYNLLGWDSGGASVVNYPAVSLTSGDVLQFSGSGWAPYHLTQSNLMQTLNGSPNTPLSAASGGTGVTNSSNMTWGSNPITWTTTGTTNVTLPTSGTLLSGTATNNNTASTIVKRDANGNFSAGAITASSFVGPVTGTVTGNVTGNVTGTATNVTATVAIGNGGTGQTSQQAAINSLLNSNGLSSGRFARWDGANVTLDVLKVGDVPQGFSRLKLAQDTANTIVVNDASGNMSVLTGGATGNVPIFNGVSWTVGPQGSGLAGIFPYGADTGAADAYVVAAPSPPVLGYSAGIGISFVAANSNTGVGTATINVDSLGLQNIKHWDGTDLVAGDIVAGQMVLLEHDGIKFQLIDPNFRARASVSNQWINAVSAEGVFSSSQPAFSNLSGTATSGQLPAQVVYNNQANTYSAGPQSLGSQALTVQIPNAGTTGTTVNKLAKINSSGLLIIMATSDTQGATGVVVAGAGTTGSADVVQIGQALCAFDGTATAGHYVQISSSVAGDCTDAGASQPTTGQTVGRVITGGAGAGNYSIEALTGGGGVGSVTSVAMSVPTGLAVSGSPITSSGTLGVTWSGTIPASSLPNPSAATLGGIESIAAVSHNFLTSISTSGVPAQAQPAFTDISGTASLTTQVTGILPVANGGTGLSSPTANAVPLTNGSSAFSTVAAGSNGNILTDNGTTWVSSVPGAATSFSESALGLGLATSVSGNALTIALKQPDGATDPTVGNPVYVPFRSSTATSGAYNRRTVTAALSIAVPSGTTIGTTNGAVQYLFVYALDNAGTVELAVSMKAFEQGSVQNTTAISTGSSASTLYSTTARTGVPIHLIGRMKITETTAGTWASNATELSVVPFKTPTVFAWSGFHGNDCDFQFTNTSFVDPSGDATCTFTTRTNYGFGTVTSFLNGGNNSSGFIFTPPDVGGYLITASIQDYNSGTGRWNGFEMMDGSSTIITTATGWGVTASRLQNTPTMVGVYVATATTSTTIKIQAAVDSASTGDINAQGIGTPTIEWSIIKIW